MHRVSRWLLLIFATLLLLGLPVAAPRAIAAGEIFVLDVQGEAALVLVLPERQLALRAPGRFDYLGLAARAARFLPGGDILVVDLELALWRFDAQGQYLLLPAGQANAPLFVSPDGQRLAFLQPRNLTPGDDMAMTNAVAVLDLKTNAVTALFALPGLTPRLYGWAGDRLLLEVPTWQPHLAAGAGRPAEQIILSTLATNAPNVPQALAALPPLAPDSRYPQTSFDQRHLAYTSAAGAVVVDLAAADYAVYAGQADPLWAETGLTVLQAAARQPLAWAAADLAPAPALSGAAALPPSAPEADYTGPAASEVVFLYRPVKASTRVSAYFDLDRNLGAIRDWLGWVGSTWIYGRAYDNHSGTDYDGVTNDAVYASAPGHVSAVVVDCANTWPNGPGSFGSYIRIEHGVQGDGASYRTLVGHLKCTGYFIGEGADINLLPLQIGQMGNTGNSSGDHTHLQVYRNGSSIDPYDWHIISDTPPLSSVGDLQGLVRDGAGQPAAGAALKLLASNAYRTGVTGADGRYFFADVPLGAATLSAVQGARWGELIVNVIGGQTTTAPDLPLDQCAGTINGADGCPLRTFDAAAFIADLTVPDAAVWPPSQPLVKTWRLLNSGTTVWGAGYHLAFVGGDQRGTPLAIPVPTTGPGFQADLSTALTTPADPGRSRGYWQMRSAEGVYFGPRIWVELNTAPVSAVITDFTVSPSAPSAAASVQVYARVQGLANFRALRLKLNGVVVTETTSTELNYTWATTGLAAIEHSLTVEAATTSDPTWHHPEQRGLVYQLLGASAALAADAKPEPYEPALAVLSPAAAPTCAVQALPATSAGPTVTVAWLGSGGTGALTFEVQYLDSGHGQWWPWLAKTAATSATFTGQLGHTYSFRCRATDATNAVGAYPGTGDTSTLLGLQTGLADLHIVDFEVAPNPWGGLWAQLTIHNAGADTQRGFYVDLYQDDVPAGPGDLTGSVHAWVNEPLAAGVTRTLEAQVVRASGQGNVTLYAQVELPAAIVESDEGNNLHTAGLTACLAAGDVYESDNMPAAAPQFPLGSSQARTLGGPGDQDWVFVTLQASHLYAAATSGLSAGLDTRLRLFGPDGVSELIANDDAGLSSLASQWRIVPPSSGVYYVMVSDWNPATGGCSSNYTLTLTDLGPGYRVVFAQLSR